MMPATPTAIEACTRRVICGKDQVLGTLTNAEIEVLRYLAAGRLLAEIAQEFGVTTRSIKMRVFRIKNKLGCATSAGMVARGFRLGILK